MRPLHYTAKGEAIHMKVIMLSGNSPFARAPLRHFV